MRHARVDEHARRGLENLLHFVRQRSDELDPRYREELRNPLMLESDRPFALRQAIMACRNGGTVSVIGVCGGFIDKFPMRSFMNRSLTMRTGQCHVQRCMKPLLHRIENGESDPASSSRTASRSRRRRRGTRRS